MAVKEITFKAQKLELLFSALKQKGFELIGPTLEDKAITYDKLDSTSDLPIGWQDTQEPGFYRLKARKDKAHFGYNIGSASFKQFLFPARQTLYEVNLKQTPQVVVTKKKKKLALIGVRACEISALLIQDKVFNKEPYQDQHYQQVRQEAFIVGLNCHTTTGTCFCVSMNTGPQVTHGYDLVLSELISEDYHYFICRSGSDRGLELLSQLEGDALTPIDHTREKAMLAKTSNSMGRHLNTQGIKEKLYAAHDSARWEESAQTCINCGNCTMACPTCFCSSHEHNSNLEQTQSSTTRVWESCFT